jgi:hypothetical protein
VIAITERGCSADRSASEQIWYFALTGLPGDLIGLRASRAFAPLILSVRCFSASVAVRVFLAVAVFEGVLRRSTIGPLTVSSSACWSVHIAWEGLYIEGISYGSGLTLLIRRRSTLDERPTSHPHPP